MKIVKHCRDQIARSAKGFLLGVEKDGVIEVTNIIPATLGQSEDLVALVRDHPSREELLKSYKQVNADPHVVGWYQSSHQGYFLSSHTLAQM